MKRGKGWKVLLACAAAVIGVIMAFLLWRYLAPQTLSHQLQTPDGYAPSHAALLLLSDESTNSIEFPLTDQEEVQALWEQLQTTRVRYDGPTDRIPIGERRYEILLSNSEDGAVPAIYIPCNGYIYMDGLRYTISAAEEQELICFLEKIQ